MSPSIHFTAFLLEAFHSEISLRNVDVSVKRILIQYNNESLNKFLWKKGEKFCNSLLFVDDTILYYEKNKNFVLCIFSINLFADK